MAFGPMPCSASRSISLAVASWVEVGVAGGVQGTQGRLGQPRQRVKPHVTTGVSRTCSP